MKKLLLLAVLLGGCAIAQPPKSTYELPKLKYVELTVLTYEANPNIITRDVIKLDKKYEHDIQSISFVYSILKHPQAGGGLDYYKDVYLIICYGDNLTLQNIDNYLLDNLPSFFIHAKEIPADTASWFLY